jgi:hypothetical protein
MRIDKIFEIQLNNKEIEELSNYQDTKYYNQQCPHCNEYFEANLDYFTQHLDSCFSLF